MAVAAVVEVDEEGVWGWRLEAGCQHGPQRVEGSRVE